MASHDSKTNDFGTNLAETARDFACQIENKFILFVLSLELRHEVNQPADIRFLNDAQTEHDRLAVVQIVEPTVGRTEDLVNGRCVLVLKFFDVFDAFDGIEEAQTFVHQNDVIGQQTVDFLLGRGITRSKTWEFRAVGSKPTVLLKTRTIREKQNVYA